MVTKGTNGQGMRRPPCRHAASMPWVPSGILAAICMGGMLAMEILGAVPAWGNVAEAPVFALDVPAMNAEPAIKSLARQTGYSVLYRSADVADIRTNALEGHYTVTDALQVLLSGTGLSGHLSKWGVITIVQDATEGGRKPASRKSRGAFWEGLVAAFASLLAVQPAASAESTGGQRIVLEEVIVTAQRRAQNVQKVPIAVSALDAPQLSTRRINNVSDLGAVAPNITLANIPGNATSFAIAIRGANNFNPGPYWDEPVGIYVDGVYLGKTQGNVFDLLDLDRIEVLRGPQGTLFGRNTMAGAINLVTRPPSGRFSGQVAVESGNFDREVGRVTMDLPAMGRLRAALGARAERRDGWVSTTGGSPEPELNNRHSDAAFAALAYDVTDSLKLNYRFDYTKIDQHGLYNQPVRSEVAQFFGIPGIEARQGRQRTASINSPDFERSRIEGNSLTATWNLGDAGTLKYIGAYREMKWHDGLDLDGSPVLFVQTENRTRYRQASHELQYLGSHDRWNWVGGLYYFSDDGYTFNPQTYFLTFALQTFDSRYGYGTRSRAAYAQADYRLTDRLTFTAGLRHTIEDKRGSRFQELVDFGLVTIPEGTAASAEFSSTTPALALAYQVADNNMIYFRYAKGFLAGGFNGEALSVLSATTPYKPQSQHSYEIGSKNLLLGGRLTLNANIFCNCSLGFGVELPGESDLDSNEGIVAAVGHGLQVAGDAAVGFGELGFSKAAGDLLLHLAHAQVTFRAVVGEGNVRIAGEE